MLFRKKIPPKGLVIKGMLAPIKTTNTAHKILTKNLTYGEISNLSSSIPTTSETNPAKSDEIITLSNGKKIRLARSAPAKRGIPPPLGKQKVYSD